MMKTAFSEKFKREDVSIPLQHWMNHAFSLSFPERFSSSILQVCSEKDWNWISHLVKI